MLIERYQRYGSIGRPVNDSNIVLKVNYGLQLIQILDLDENKQILHTNCWSMYVSDKQEFRLHSMDKLLRLITRATHLDIEFFLHLCFKLTYH